jgi:predicted MFS family arabinose efflux permease
MSRSLKIRSVIFAFIRTVFNTMFRMVYPFLPVFSRGLGVELTSLSLTITSRQTMGIIGPFIAILLENRGRKIGMLTGLGLFTTGVVLVVVWPVYPAFIIALMLTSLGKYMFDPHMQALLGEQVPYEHRGLALAITEIGWSASFIVGIPLMGLLISRNGWMSPFGALSFLGFVSMVLVLKLIPNTLDDRIFWSDMRRNIINMFHYPPAVAGLLVGASVSAANEVINLIFGVWLEDSFGLQIMALGGAAAVIGISELGGETLMGLISDRFGKERSVGVGLVANCISAAIFPILGKNISGAVIALFLFYITFEFTLVSIIPMMSEIMPSARVTLMAFNIAAISLGRSIGALATTQLYKFGIWGSSITAIGFNLLSLLALWWLFVSKKISFEYVE